MLPEAEVEQLFRDLRAAGERPAGARALLVERDPDDFSLRILLRRALPVAVLEVLGNERPWCVRPEILGGIVLSPRVPPSLALRLVGGLFWRDLAEVAATARLPSMVRLRAEALLLEQLPDLRVGDRIALARLATPALLRAVLGDADRRVLEAALWNPRLREADLVVALRQEGVSRLLLESVSRCPRWSASYPVRIELVLQPRTPLGIALGQLTALLDRDLRRVREAQGVAPLLALAAARVLERRAQVPSAQ